MRVSLVSASLGLGLGAVRKTRIEGIKKRQPSFQPKMKIRHEREGMHICLVVVHVSPYSCSRPIPTRRKKKGF